MTFLQPLLLLGLAGAAVPVLIHLFGKPRARPLRFPAVELLERALADPAPRRRLRDRLLLLARIAAAASLALVLARPARWAAGAAGGGARRVAVVLDDSFSMGLRDDGTPVFDRARDAARAAIDAALDAGGEAALVLGGQGATDPVAACTANRARLLGALDDAQASARATDLAGAVGRARAALGGSGRVVVVTDGTAPVPEGDDVDVVDVTAGAALDNTALVRAEARPAADDTPGVVHIEAEVAHHADRPRTVVLELRAGGRTLSRSSVALAPRARQTRSLSARLPAGVRSVEVAIDTDNLTIDDTRHVAAEGVRPIRVLAVNGDPRATRAEDELFYLRTALEAAGEPPVQLQTAAPEETAARLADQDAVLLCNVRSLPEADAFAVRAFVRAGGGLLVTAGSHTNPDLPQPLADLLPGDPVAVWSAGPAGPSEDPGRLQHLGAADVHHPALAAFGAQPDALRSARFWSRVVVRAPATGDRRVPLRFEDGAPALLERDVGDGRVLQFASTIDRDWGDLVIRPAFAPLLRQLVRHLARRRTISSVDVLVGEPCPPPAGARGEVRVSRPDGRPDGRPHGGVDRADAPYAATDVPGVYLLRAGDGTEAACAVHVDPRESDLRRVARPAVRASTARDVPRRAVPMAHAFAAALLGLLLAESLLSRRR